MIAPDADHCSHAYLDEALVIRGEATVNSRRQEPRAVGPACRQEADSRRDPPVGGRQWPAEKPASADADTGTRAQPDVTPQNFDLVLLIKIFARK